MTYYSVESLSFSRPWHTTNSGLIKLHDDGRIIGIISSDEGLIVSVRTLRERVDALSLAYIFSERPKKIEDFMPILPVQQIVLQSQDIGTQYHLTDIYNGIHTLSSVFVSKRILNRLYTNQGSFQSMDTLHDLLITYIDVLIENKRIFFDSRNNLEYVACANGQTYNLLLRESVKD